MNVQIASPMPSAVAVIAMPFPVFSRSVKPSTVENA